MSLDVAREVIEETKDVAFVKTKAALSRWGNDQDVHLDTETLDDGALEDLRRAAEMVKDAKTVRAVESILRARAGDFSAPMPNFKALQGVLRAFFRCDMLDGWVYCEGQDGMLYPELITEIKYEDPGRHKSTPRVTIITASYTRTVNRGDEKKLMGVKLSSHSFEPSDVAKRRVSDALAKKGLYKETPELKRDHAAHMARHRDLIQNGFAKQFRVDGAINFHEGSDYYSRIREVKNRRVIHDLDAESYGAMSNHIESALMEGLPGREGVGEIPEHPLVRLFDLKSHDFYWAHSAKMTAYEYDKSLRDKLVLPESHRDLLDVLTSDLGAFVDDIVEGKSAGNVILCKGIPGVGKTLTAEVYAELIEKPLYSIHTGTLGTSAAAIEKNLQTVFKRSKRWSAVLLLDEADVFLVQRGNDVEQNAIVAEFLRTLEYFDGLLFATTNRPMDIDEAIISRCAAIIGYEVPKGSAVASVWRVMATQYKTELPGQLVDELLRAFPSIAPRDIKMLLRLALRVSKSSNEPLSIETFRRCAMFRAIEIAE
jgi:hypothetical protein